MPLIYRLLICIVVATPISAIYHYCELNGGLGFLFDLPAALAFSGTAIICMLLSSVGASDSTASATSPAKATKSKPSKPKGNREVGEVKWFSGAKGFGFIRRDNGEEIFVHFRSVDKSSGRLAPGLRVEYEIVAGEKGPEAQNVVVIS